MLDNRRVSRFFAPLSTKTVLLRWLAIVVRQYVRSLSCRAAMVFVLAGQACGHGAYHDVVEELTKKIALTPDDAALHFKLASAHQEHGEWKAALVECERVRRLGAVGFDTDFIEGKALAAGGHLEAAKSLLNAFLAKQPLHREAMAERARVLWKLGEREMALRDYAEAWSSLKPDFLIEASKAFNEAGRREEALKRLRELPEPDPAIWNMRLDLELAGGHFDEALICVEALKKAAPRPEPWMARRAEVLALAQRPAEARAAWNDLHQHLMALPSLVRGTPLLAGLLT
jgi:tetratricopeptide (TPR) repeat protein